MESRLSTFVATDGENVAIQDWPLEPEQPVRGVVVLVHGLGEHAGRYDALAQQLNDWGFAVRGYDQWGHGESGGVPGGLPSDNRLLDDLADIVDSTRARHAARVPLILLGHSMGGLVAARFVSLNLRPVDGLVLSSPAFQADLSTLQKWMLAVLPHVTPNLRVPSGVEPRWLSHDPQAIAAYRADPLVHDRISARLAHFIATAAPQTLALAGQWRVPTLLLYAGQDHVVNPQGSRQFAATAPKQMVTTRCFEGMYHEIFNESDAVAVRATLQAWLDTHF